MTHLFYFAYGSNMSLRRLRARTPSAEAVGRATLPGHVLRFHKQGRDGSAKCDAAAADDTDLLHGVLFRIAAEEKPGLDAAEGLGRGYELHEVRVTTRAGDGVQAFTYRATHIDADLLPFGWYKAHVLAGAREHGLPEAYIRAIEAVPTRDDPDPGRHAREMAIHTEVKT